MSTNTTSGRIIWVILLSLLVVLSIITVPLPVKGDSDGPDTAFESFEFDFESAAPEKPDDVELRWTLTEEAADVERVRITIINETNHPINLYNTGGPDIPNPFNVTAADGNASSDLVVENLTATTIDLKVPTGHCERVDEVRVRAYSDDRRGTNPDIRKASNCSPSTDTGTFNVTIDEYDEEVTVRDNVSVTAKVENTDEIEATQDIRFSVDEEKLESRENVTISGNQSEEISFTYESNESDVPEINITVESEDDAATRTVAVTEPEPAFFAVSIEDAPTDVFADETVNVTVGIENTGDRSGTQNVTLADFDDEIVTTSAQVDLSAGESTTLLMNWSTGTDDSGEGNVTVRSHNETDTEAITITQPTVESVTANLTEAELEEGERTSILVEATFTDGSTQNVTDNATLTSPDTAIATVATDGTVTATGEGTVEIEALFENETDADTLTVTSSEENSSDSADDESDDSDGEEGEDSGSDESDDSNDDGSDDGSNDSNSDGSSETDEGGSESDTDGGNGSDDSGSDGPTAVKEDENNGDGSAPAEKDGNDDSDGDGSGEADDGGSDDSSGDESDPIEEGESGDGGDGKDEGKDYTDGGDGSDDADHDGGDEFDGEEERSVIVFPALGWLLLIPLLSSRDWSFGS